MKEVPEVEAKTLDLDGCDIILLCSDGLTRHVEETDILEVVTHHSPPEAARRLVDLANERGGQDNISVVIAELQPSATERVGIPAEQHNEQ
jgi:PPM family protein phosphatase